MDISLTCSRWDAAELDARLATLLDEGYAKAWARLGAAKLVRGLLVSLSACLRFARASAKWPKARTHSSVP